MSSSSDQSEAPNEVTVENDDFKRADLQFQPVSNPTDNTFSISLLDDDVEGDVTRITHEKESQGRHLLKAQFDPLNPSSVSVKCRNENAGTTKKMATIRPANLKANGETGAVASTRDWPSSFHYINYEGGYAFEVDYGGAADPGTMVDFSNSDQPRECTHITFTLNDVSTSISADGIRFEGIDRRPTFRKQAFR